MHAKADGRLSEGHPRAAPTTILAVDLYDTALVLEEFWKVIICGSGCVVIASLSGHRLGTLTAEQNEALGRTPAHELLALPMLQPEGEGGRYVESRSDSAITA